MYPYAFILKEFIRYFNLISILTYVIFIFKCVNYFVKARKVWKVPSTNINDILLPPSFTINSYWKICFHLGKLAVGMAFILIT